MRPIFAPLLIVSVALAGCGRPNDKVLAVVNGQTITDRDVQTRMSKLAPALRQALKSDRRRLLEEMVLEALLVQEARRRGLERDAQVQELLREAKKQILIGRLLEREGRQQVQVDDQQIAEFYEANKARFAVPERWRASHVLVPTEEKARAALDRLSKGESLEKVAGEMSEDASKSRGGDIGFFSKGQLIPEFEEASMQLKVGQTSGIVKTSLGYHIIQLTDHQPVQQKGLAETKEQIVQELKSQKERGAVDQFVGKLRKQAQIFIREDQAKSSKEIPAAPAAEPAAVPAEPGPGAQQ
ncbi:MAG: peptidyl-prolyl cis-trans isomerase [Candidatus Omnitrophica bacterium]|nr:peptidyl-prolyl cis-trans isomerase [Candidatus Omnitrophota bacterium]